MSNKEINYRSPNEQEIAEKKRVLKEVENARARMVVRHPFVGSLVMKLELIVVVDSRLPTACTDGKAIYLNVDHWNSLTDSQRTYLIAHEVWHCVYQHFVRKQSRDHKRFNYATDLEIDFMLEDSGFDVYDMLTYKQEWRDEKLSAEEIYERLEKEVERPESADKHIYEGDNPLGQSEGNEEDGQEFIQDPDYKPGLPADVTRTWQNNVVSAVQNVQRTLGSVPAFLEQLVKELYQPQISWKQVLQEFVTSCFGGSRQWLPPNRRYVHAGQYFPSRRQEFLSIAVAVDTSGSTYSELPQFLAELKGIVNAFGRYDVVLIECDMEIKRVRHYSEWDPFESTEVEFAGFGGTSFNPVFEYIEKQLEEPKLLIYLTDGYGDTPLNPPPYPVLWVITPEGKKPSYWGQAAYLKDN